MKNKYIGLAAILLTCCAHSALAAGWVRDAGKGLFIQNASYYSASKFYDLNARKRNQNRYTKYELNPYVEYGVTERLTLGANIFLSHVSQYDARFSSNSANYGIGDTELFARSLIWKGKGFSFEPIVKLPHLDSQHDVPSIGSKYVDAGMGISGGYGYTAWGLEHYVNLDAGYRHRFGTPNDQLRFVATAGFSVTENILFTGQFSRISSLNQPESAMFTQSSGDDYELSKIQFLMAYKFADNMSVGLGVFADINGKNTGGGKGSVFNLSREF